ncbi:Rossmann-like and DUF2520 domain-containing protein [Hymenobacter puniceus]|uniref:Rossmann-like and DUF2520 domain-containing protein n=1 Tax=Hymenobacter sp. BT190 TaxID=2763505 RepID=UPI001651A36C|nr:Rossmann-like and DUF2520 domain-containing protein [Hymenobacter sp. BT190]MBC6697481.1 DUF2520 domain-containing protein [Hymenobacter sp. BT190]
MTSDPALSLRIVLLGAGRVASQLAPALHQAGHQVAGIWSRSPGTAAALAATLPNVPSLPTLDLTSLPSADVYLLAVPDAAIPAVLAQAHFPAGALVAHTSGAVPLSVFESTAGIVGGVFYPLQTFSAERTVDWRTVPLCVEGATPTAQLTLLALGHTLSGSVQPVGTPQRQAIHIAAVFACNFTNHLLGISHALLQQQQLPLALLAPLLQETMEKALAHPPFTVQTGPAARHDAPTLARHRAALASHPAWLDVYNSLTSSIQEQLVPSLINNQGGVEL